MPTLRDLMSMICAHAEQAHGISLGEQCARDLERLIRQSFPAERVYIPPANSPHDPARTEAIRQAAARLPTGVVAQRFGISRQAVYKLARKK
jgi:DNA-binding transcriptional regulator LsrR (DeoR family)